MKVFLEIKPINESCFIDSILQSRHYLCDEDHKTDVKGILLMP